MRELTEGFEGLQDGNSDLGSIGISAPTQIRVYDIADLDETYVHRDASGEGGVKCLGSTLDFRDFSGPPLSRPLVEFWVRWCFRAAVGDPAECQWLDVTLSQLGLVQKDAGNKLRIYTGPSTLRATSVQTLPGDAMTIAHVHVKIANSGGFVRVYVNNDLTSPFVEYTGDTQPGAESETHSMGWQLSTATSLDDIAVNSLSIKYDNGNGTAPVVGNTLTGTGAPAPTAIITAVYGDGISGTLLLTSYFDADAGAATDFSDNMTITSDSGFSGLVDAPNALYERGLEPESGPPPEGYVIFRSSTADGTTIQLDGSDGNQVDNFALVNTEPASGQATYVEGQVADEYDTYLTQDLPASAGKVNVIVGRVSAQQDGTTLPKMRHVFRTGGVDYFGDDLTVPLSYGVLRHTWAEMPDGSGQIDAADWNAAEIGYQVRGP